MAEPHFQYPTAFGPAQRHYSDTLMDMDICVLLCDSSTHQVTNKQMQGVMVLELMCLSNFIES